MSVVSERLAVCREMLISIHEKVVECFPDLGENMPIPRHLDSIYSLAEVIREVDRVVDVLINYPLKIKNESLVKICECLSLLNSFLPEDKKIDVDTYCQLSLEEVVEQLKRSIESLVELEPTREGMIECLKILNDFLPEDKKFHFNDEMRVEEILENLKSAINTVIDTLSSNDEILALNEELLAKIGR